MIKLLFFLIFLTIFAFISMWFIENDGSILIEWFGYQIQTSVSFTILLGIIILILLTLFGQIIFIIKNSKRNRLSKSKDKGISSLTKGFAAIAAGDIKEAKKLTNKAQNYLGTIPLTRLLSAQIAQIEGNDEIAKDHYNNMLENKETEIIAIKGLLLQANKSADLVKSIYLAEKALKIKPNANWAILILIDLYKKNSQWDKTLDMLEKAMKNKLLDTDSCRKSISNILIAKSEEALSNNEIDNALKFAKQAYKERPEYIEAGIYYARLLVQNKENRSAIKILEKIWTIYPNHETATLYLKIFSDLPAAKKLSKIEQFIKSNPNHALSHYYIAKIAFEANNINKAKNHTKIAININESAASCMLMAKIVQIENAPQETIEEWQNRAQLAPQEQNWSCQNCGTSYINWQIICKSCKSFDSIKLSNIPTKVNLISNNDDVLGI